MDAEMVRNLAVILESIVVMRTDDLMDSIVEDVVMKQPVDEARALASRVDNRDFRFECLVFVWWNVDLLLFRELDADRCEALAVALTGCLFDHLENKGFGSAERGQLESVRRLRFLEYGSFAHQGGPEGMQALFFAAWRHIVGRDFESIMGPFILLGVADLIMTSLRPLILKLRAL